MIAYLQFNPELVIVSSGYDAAIGDAEVVYAFSLFDYT